MKVSTLIVLVALSILNLAGASKSELLQRIETVDSLFSHEGPTSNVLQEYQWVVNDIESREARDVALPELEAIVRDYLPQLYFKKALIELNLNKDAAAIGDLKKVLQLDPTKKPAKIKLVEILLEKGDVVTLKQFLNLKEDSETIEKIQHWEKSIEDAERLFLNNDFLSCVRLLEEDVLSLTPSNGQAHELHYQSILRLYHNDPTLVLESRGEKIAVAKIIIRDIQTLIKLQPLANLKLYDTLSNFFLFTESQFDIARSYIKNCLRIDNDFKPCGSISKFLTKFQDFLRLFEEYSIIIGHYYVTLEGSSSSNLNDELVDPGINFKFVNDFLFHSEIKVSKLEKRLLPPNIKNNYDYLLHRASTFLVEHAGSDVAIGELKFTNDLNKISCESFIRMNDVKRAGPYCAKVKDAFLPKSLPDVDKLLQAKKFGEAQAILDQFNANVKQTKMFSDRYHKIEEVLKSQQQQQQQRQQQHFRQQQQQQRQYQQQQQQRQQSNAKPANDYYKILDISRDADDKTIKKAYRAQTLKYHPDKFMKSGLSKEEIETKMQDVNQAYEVLSNKELKERYDRGDDPNVPNGAGTGGGNPFGNAFKGGNFNFGQQFSHQFFQNGGGAGGFGFGGSSQFGGFGKGHRHKVKFSKNKKKRS
ncbi:Molecular chaperone (DnaJ superfamily) [Scheffersomyces stipitis CBS 6054]|uniref:Molecular chaperone (DnaJ superfamily) n=1 Tax=Scheffersomyces stipitis (strain ATCC 58785 / CBS 6054 / NBRC 10063 / NRRL Y-11545) TaxID=322104 RepID=A3LTW7_PICST|nr:Molecular chaperone (DnaJ superfamily) [Scheffersomyces stipitis CBS 6054]ABN66137.2 Molecular chaperone (DnaJ superfamily) [Scheffersomyces stipitis CBS 6054]